MGRQYIASTPASRGKEEPEVEEANLESFLAKSGLSEEEFREVLEEAAAELGLRLVAIEPEAGDDSEDADGQKPPEDPNAPVEPAGNASTEAWVAYAVATGASEDDLKDADGEPLGRDDLRAKYGTSGS